MDLSENAKKETVPTQRFNVCAALAFAFVNATVNTWGAEGTFDLVSTIDYYSWFPLMFTLLVAIFLAWKKPIPSFDLKSICLLAMIVTSSGQLSPLLITFFPSPLVLGITIVLSGAGMGILLVLLIHILSIARPDRLVTLIAFGYLIMILLLLCFSAVPAQYAMALRAAFTLLGAFCVLLALQGNYRLQTRTVKPAITKQAGKSVLLFFLAINLIGLPLSAIHNLSLLHRVAGTNTATYQLPTLWMNFALIALICIALMISRPIRTHQIYRFIIATTILALLILPIFGAESIYPYFVTMVSYMFFSPLLWIMGIEVARALKVSPVLICSFTLFWYFFDNTLPLAEVLDSLVISASDPGLILNLMNLGGVAAIVTAYIWVFPEKRVIGITTIGDDFTASAELVGYDGIQGKLAQTYRLTKREIAVLALLAKGRSGARIQKELGISPGTFNFHSANIYHKLDVHDKQELIDFAERFIKDNAIE